MSWMSAGLQDPLSDATKFLDLLKPSLILACGGESPGGKVDEMALDRHSHRVVGALRWCVLYFCDATSR